MARNYKRNPEEYPLANKEGNERLRIHRALLLARKRWGGSDAQWAKVVGRSTKTVQRWADGKHNGITSDALDATCSLFGVSREYLVNGGVAYKGFRFPTWNPTAGEHDRFDQDRLVNAYSNLDENDQRTVTRVIQGLLLARIMTDFYQEEEALYDTIVARVRNGELTRDDIVHVFGGVDNEMLIDAFYRSYVKEHDTEARERDLLLESIENLKEGGPDEKQGSDEDV